MLIPFLRRLSMMPSTPRDRFLTSHRDADWVEPPLEESRRNTLAPTDPATSFRELYPLSAILRKADGHQHYPEGYVFTYARPRRAPSAFPIEVVVVKHVGAVTRTQRIYYSSEEATLRLPVTPAGQD